MSSTRILSPGQDLFSVSGLVAVITGGGSGIGWMMAKALAESGAERVYIVGRRREKLVEAAKGYNKYVQIIRETLPWLRAN